MILPGYYELFFFPFNQRYTAGLFHEIAPQDLYKSPIDLNRVRQGACDAAPAAGYNPTFMTKFFLRLYQANPKQPFKLLSTHPPTTERIEYTSSYLDAFPLETEMQIDSKDFKDMKARLK